MFYPFLEENDSEIVYFVLTLDCSLLFVKIFLQYVNIIDSYTRSKLMKILIICTYYPPDTAIAAVRPYMLAKYLTKLGHDVTVVRSGEFYNKPDESFIDENLAVRVYSYLGQNSPVERYLRGEAIASGDVSKARGRLKFLPSKLRIWLGSIYSKVAMPLLLLKKLNEIDEKSEILKKFIDGFQEKNFDVVFATFSNLENAYAGANAAKKFNCKYILDFRDLIAQRVTQPFLEFIVKSRIQKKVVAQADICTTVSEGLTEEIKKQSPHKPVFTIYNGYEKNIKENVYYAEEGKLSFCYTGTIYGNLRNASPIFKVLKRLKDDGKINTDNISFHYAGGDFETLLKQAMAYGMTDILINHGYVNKEEAKKIQSSTDLFTVLSWNTKSGKGILTGKFYEALKNQKPVIACVSGKEPQSELCQIITKYNLGVCVEEADKTNGEEHMYHYIEEQYSRKMNGDDVLYEPKSEVFEKFEYCNIAKEMDNIIRRMLNI